MSNEEALNSVLNWNFMTSYAIIASAEAPAKSVVPELPNFLTFLRRLLHDTSWGTFLHQWENVIFSVLIASIVTFVFYMGTRKKELVPSGFQNFLELAVEYLRSMVIEILGPQGEKYVPLLGTLFIYILSMNLVGLVPFMKSPSSNLNITVGLAIFVFVLVQYLNIKNMGLKGFLYHLSGSPKDFVGWLMVPLMLPIEIITQLTRPLTLAFRLFGNIFGEDTIIAAFSIFGVSMLSFISPYVGFPLQVPFMLLGALTGTMQALVFTLLSTIYILLSMPDHEEHSSH